MLLRFKQREVNLFLLFKYHLNRHADGHGLGIDIDDLSAESQARLLLEFHSSENIRYGQIWYPRHMVDGKGCHGGLAGYRFRSDVPAMTGRAHGHGGVNVSMAGLAPIDHQAA